jgi:hypothetical protein
VGLSIVKKIIDNLGATISVTNNRSGGACFTCLFKAREEPAVRKEEEVPPDRIPNRDWAAGGSDRRRYIQ